MTGRGATTCCTRRWRRPATCSIRGCGRATPTRARAHGGTAGDDRRVSRYFGSVRMRADSGFYDQRIVKICAEREVEFFIVAEQRRNLLKAVHAIPDSEWKSFERKQIGARGPQRAAAPAAREPQAQDHPGAQARHVVQRQTADRLDRVSTFDLEAVLSVRDQAHADHRQGRQAAVPARRAARSIPITSW